ncbi:hypothetical protein CBW65_18720 [Tumebacillus avium]|uniref:Uncharacterized protein n=1 Tax=Tumebacillus avium TaxID=1903704 RepID=A0A1Y0ISJ4_9BACL|nr:hypothetical protein [Tumebacillus avium]ARU62776.1 hypothetical protein CBW65_18720 [Tumebacillus avium]
MWKKNDFPTGTCYNLLWGYDNASSGFQYSDNYNFRYVAKRQGLAVSIEVFDVNCGECEVMGIKRKPEGFLFYIAGQVCKLTHWVCFGNINIGFYKITKTRGGKMSSFETWKRYRDEFISKLEDYGYRLTESGTSNKKLVVEGRDYQFKVIFRYSTRTEKTGYSFTFNADEFGDDENSFFVYALVGSNEVTRYLIINHAIFKSIMEKPFQSNTYLTTGSYTFNFGKADSEKLGKWAEFVGGIEVFEKFYSNSDLITIPRSVLYAMKKKLYDMQNELDRLLG